VYVDVAATETGQQLERNRAYYQSELWQLIRQRVFARDGGQCRGCSSSAECVHHLAYDQSTMRGGCINELISLCKTCHHYIHFNSSGERRSFNSVRRKTYSVIRKGRYQSIDLDNASRLVANMREELSKVAGENSDWDLMQLIILGNEEVIAKAHHEICASGLRARRQLEKEQR
jgi:hypothetical protein